ncbi:M23 family metallopeptidase [Candidatus Hepatobacter penaei]|uniref:M23 family metallopeptidase n=1 Tax=Candidatus Hepatobacter penaei TaxID=1274402 RepID=UPI0006989F86|nr:M23 family metallopeptidase [Candidatus Hepatobacter penaei]
MKKKSLSLPTIISAKLFFLMLSLMAFFKPGQDVAKMGGSKPLKSGKKKAGRKGKGQNHDAATHAASSTASWSETPLSTVDAASDLLVETSLGSKAKRKKGKASVKTRTNAKTKTSAKRERTAPPKTHLASFSIYKPVKKARLSSHFGYRHHPVLKQRKLHKGMDFAAPIGTPVHAAADGKIVKVTYNGGYGRYIRIRHANGTMETAYAHLSRYKKGIHIGQKVRKDEVIGYVGTTGRSTGPHLHFELIKDGKHINPKNFLT